MYIKLDKLIIAANLFFNLFSNVFNISDIPQEKISLKFDNKGSFKVLQFSDTHEKPASDKTIELMNKIIDYEKPNLVVLTGDNIDGRCKTSEEVKNAITLLASPMESRDIPWAVVFGNHDNEYGTMSKEAMMRFYMGFKHNISQIGYKSKDRVGNYNLLIWGSKSKTPIFNIYMIDSGTYSTAPLGGFAAVSYGEICWYKRTSYNLWRAYNKFIPSLMFLHIPLPEFKTAYYTGLISGGMMEKVSSPIINTGLFKTLVKGGDVKGVFAGHDHLNNYCALYKGIRLGYAGSASGESYGMPEVQHEARVFIINEADPANFKTYIRHEWDKELALP